jgi:hypothetical protein
MPPTKKVKMLTRVLEFCWALGVDMVALMERHVRVDEGAREAVAMCLDSDSLFGLEVQKLVSHHSMVPRREAMSLAGYVHHVASIVSFIARCTRQLYCDIYREAWGKEGLPSREVDYDGEFRLSRSTLGELALMIYLMHQPGGHMCLRRIKKILYLAAQGASNDMKGGLIVMGKRILVHSDRYKPEVQLIGSTPKELLAMDEAMALATAEFDRAVNVENLSPAHGRKWMRLFLEGKGVAGAERVPERDVPLSSVGADLEEFDAGVLCLFGDNTSSVSAVRKGVSSNPHMMRCLDNIMVSCVKTDFAAFSFYLSGPEMEGNGIDDISRGKTEAVRTMGEVGLHAKANTVMNPFASQSWGLPMKVRALIEKQFGDKVKYFASGNGLTAAQYVYVAQKHSLRPFALY